MFVTFDSKQCCTRAKRRRREIATNSRLRSCLFLVTAVAALRQKNAAAAIQTMPSRGGSRVERTFNPLFGIREKQGRAFLVPRGGSDDSAEDSLEEATDAHAASDHANDAADEVTTSTAAKKKASLSSWLLGSLFELNDDIKSEASLEDGEPVAPSRSASISSNTGRGGALVKEKPPNRFKWLSVLDASKVAPTIARLVRDDNEEEDSTSASEKSTTSRITESVIASAKSVGKPITASVVASAKSVKKVWWVNTWADQMPDALDEERMAELELSKAAEKALASSTTDNDNNAIDATEEPLVETEDAIEPLALNVTEPSELLVQTTLEQAEIIQETEPLQSDDITADTALAKQMKQPEIAELELVESETKKSKKHKKSKSKAKKKAKLAEAAAVEAKKAQLAVGKIDAAVHNVSHSAPVNASVASPEVDRSYVSSGYWNSIDRLLTLGYADSHPTWRVSSRLRTVRKTAAKVTGLHGVLSGKPYQPHLATEPVNDEHLGLIRRRLAAIDRARRNVERATAVAGNATATRRRFFWSRKSEEATEFSDAMQSSKEKKEQDRRTQRVNEIDKQMKAAQLLLTNLACEKDVLQQRPNPLWNYTTDTDSAVAKSETDDDSGSTSFSTAREFNFPPADLVEEYLDMLFSSGRLVKLNHTDLWRNGNTDDYDDEDELSSPKQKDDDRMRNGNGGSGSWLLRNGIGEKIGEATESAACKGVCKALMSVLARSISSLHGLNVMGFSDIGLSTEQAPDLPPISAGMIPGSGKNRNYAHDAIQDAMRRGAKKPRYNKRRDSFIQLDAVVETLTSQCQIAAPLMKLFPLAWQRAIIANIVILSTAVIADFCEGLEFQILGHKLSVSFTPITEEDMIRGMIRDNFNNPRRTDPEQFEAAVFATAEAVSENLKILDRWHERALGSGVLRTQIATLIARLVLTLVDDVLRASRLDLWAVHAGGPRLVAGLAYRTTPSYIDGSGR